jgi:hypothetical protein
MIIIVNGIGDLARKRENLSCPNKESIPASGDIQGFHEKKIFNLFGQEMTF